MTFLKRAIDQALYFDGEAVVERPDPNICFMADPADPGAGGGGAADPKAPEAPNFDSAQFKKRLEREREKGRKATLADMEAAAKKRGFKSLDAFLSDAPAPQREIPKPPRPENRDPKNKNGQHQAAQLSKADREKLERADRLEKENAVARNKAARLQKRLHAQEANHAIEKMLIANGVKDVDVTAVLLRQKVKNMTDDERNDFDEVKWVNETLKKDRPYLFGVVEKPANSGTGTPPGQKAPITPPNNEGFDAMTATPEQMKAFMEKNNLSTVN